jgi:hypothetical protein
VGYAIPIQMQQTFTTIECYKCGVVFAVDAKLESNWRRDKTQFFCPNGHGQSYIESEADRLRKQLADAQRDRDWQKQRAETLNEKLDKQKKAATLLKKRVNCGVCPHCQRTVRQMAAHIKSKHPEALERRPG